MKYVTIVSDWNQIDYLGDKPLEHGEKIKVLWGNGEITTETTHVIPYMTNHYGQGGSDIIEHRQAYIKVLHNGSPINIRLHSANLLCERV